MMTPEYSRQIAFTILGYCERPDPFDSALKFSPELANLDSFNNLANWYHEQVDRLGPMPLEVVEVADGKVWQTLYSYDNNSARSIVRKDGKRFSLRGVEVVKNRVFKYNQPCIANRAELFDVPKAGGVKEKEPVSGFIGLIMSKSGKVLITVDQETLARSPNGCVIRAPIQTTIDKERALQNGEINQDPQLHKLLQILKVEHGTQDLVNESKYVMYPLNDVDSSVVVKANLGFVLVVPDGDALFYELEKDGSRKWLTPDQMTIAVELSAVNGHLAVLWAQYNNRLRYDALLEEARCGRM